MQKSLLLFPLLFAFSTTIYAGDELLFECVSDKNTHLRLAANQHQIGEITFDFKQAIRALHRFSTPTFYFAPSLL